EQRCAEQFLTHLQTGYGDLSLTIRVHWIIKVGSHPFPRRRPLQGRQQLLNTSAALVPAVVCSPNNQQPFGVLLNQVRNSVEPGNSVANAGHVPSEEPTIHNSLGPAYSVA